MRVQRMKNMLTYIIIIVNKLEEAVLDKVLVSACLLGENCKYSGGNNYNKEVAALKKRYELISVCPEQLGGLPTPRVPCEIAAGRVVNQDGADKTEAFVLGARRSLELAQKHNCTLAVLKENSPSCGSGTIYDGSFTGKLITGNGITAALFVEKGIKVVGESQVNKI